MSLCISQRSQPASCTDAGIPTATELQPASQWSCNIEGELDGGSASLGPLAVLMSLSVPGRDVTGFKLVPNKRHEIYLQVFQFQQIYPHFSTNQQD
eukprot:3714577-Rhodomonas_salina.1